MLPTQGVIRFSEHSALYDIVVKKNNKWRRLNDMTDYSFVYDELKDRYCPDNGRMAEDPVRMFKYLMIKSILGVSDADLVEHCMTDMALKFFLGLVPEASCRIRGFQECGYHIQVHQAPSFLPLRSEG